MGRCRPEYKFLSAAQLLRLFTDQAVDRNTKDENSFQVCLMMSMEDKNGISCTQRSSDTTLLKVFFFFFSWKPKTHTCSGNIKWLKQYNFSGCQESLHNTTVTVKIATSGHAFIKKFSSSICKQNQLLCITMQSHSCQCDHLQRCGFIHRGIIFQLEYVRKMSLTIAGCTEKRWVFDHNLNNCENTLWSKAKEMHKSYISIFIW